MNFCLPQKEEENTFVKRKRKEVKITIWWNNSNADLWPKALQCLFFENDIVLCKFFKILNLF